MSRRSRILGFGAAALLVVAGVAGGVGFGGTLGQLLALILISVGLVLATALVFLEVGLSEDRERAREAGRRSPSGEWPRRARLASRLGRMRGSRRRLR